MTIAPHDYIKLRRQAAGVTIADIAAKIATSPHVAEHIRAGWIELIEAGTMPASFATIVALRAHYRFDMAVLERLVAISLGATLPVPRLCRVCACSELDPCIEDGGFGCRWAAQDLCSSCAPVSEPASAAFRGEPRQAAA